MKGRLAFALAVLLTLGACAPATQTASATTTGTPSPAPEPTVAPATLPPPTAVPTPVLTPPPPEPTPQPFAPLPEVRVQSGAFTLELLPTPFEASGQIRADASDMVKSWVPMYLEALDRYRAESTPDTKRNFESFVAAGPYLEVVRRSLGDLYAPGVQPTTRQLVLTKLAVDHVWAKPWGRPAYVDATLGYDDKITASGSTKTEPHVSVVRLVNQGQGFLKVLDGFDTLLGRWINGESPRYSAPALETELSTSVASVLLRESYVKGEPYPHSLLQPGFPTQVLTPFQVTYETAIGALDDQYKRGDFVERRFEDAVARLSTFEPATFIGDGVVTVSVDAKLVAVDKAGAPHVSPLSIAMRFYRITRDGTNAGWILIDEQGKTGAWISGGNLALAQIDQDRG